MNKEIKRIKRELQCEGAITKYYKDTVELPDGKIAVWDFVGHNGAAAAIGVLDDGRIYCKTTDLVKSNTTKQIIIIF